jgi:ABC-type multidrug transport system ATPase subunit
VRATIGGMINVVDVTHHYGVKPVLRHVSLQVHGGEVVALMGPNGMGKSTLMAVMAGVMSPLRGYVEIEGLRRRSSEQAELAIRKQVVYLPAGAWLPSGVTPREWLLGVGRVYEIEDERLMDHVDRLLELFDLRKQSDEVVAGLSTGQKKKLALCGALATEAPVMLLDEPFSGGLDPSGIMALKRVLQRHARGDRFTIVMATPVPELVEELADRIAIIRDGQIVAYDTIDGLRRLTNTSGKLDEIYERLISPDTSGKIDRYFADQEPRR